MKHLVALCLLMGIVVMGVPRHGNAVEIIPATAHDIVNALGPDAAGLALSQEALPDLFTLTANRVEEDAKQFTVQQPYTSGRWKGGKVVIEYARDLSYTQVSVYDKQGHRQRLYSVSTNFTEHVERLKAQSQDSSAGTPVKTVAMVPTPAPTPTAKSESKYSYEWDESKGAYVPAASSSSGVDQLPAEVVAIPQATEEKTTTPSRKRKHHRADTELAQAPSHSEAADDGGDKVWIPPKKHPSNAVKVKVDNTTWVERKPDDSAQAPAAPHHRKKRHPAAEVQTPTEKVSVPVVASAKTSVEPMPSPASTSHNKWVPENIQDTPNVPQNVQPAKNAVVEDSVPSESDLLATTPEVSKEPEKPKKSSERKSSRSAHETKSEAKEEPAPEVMAKAQPVTPPPPSMQTSEPAAVPSTEDLLASNDNGKSDKKSGPDTSEGDAWVPKAAPKPVVAEPVAPAPEPVKVAMIPKRAPVDNSVDNLLTMANQNNAKPSHESDTWVPQKTALPKPEVDIDKEVKRVRAEEIKKAAVPKVVKVKQDVNNPEEGVLPVSTFEKYSGPMYGRHREYERRFVPGKNKHGKVPDHDFYVDEIDRKKEIHNVYYYTHQKGKGPRLVAVERHDKVSFLGNYDIDKEDKGKVSTYN